MENQPRWIKGSNENISYLHYSGNKIGAFITVGFNQFGIGVCYYNHVLSLGEKPIKKLLINFCFFSVNITFR